MKIRTTSTGLAALLGIGVALAALPAAAQEQADADADADGFVTAEEATAHSQGRFGTIAEGGEKITLEQFNASMIGPELVGAEAGTSWNPETEFNVADADQDGGLTSEEWMKWREVRFEQAAGAESRVEAGLYQSIDSGGPMAGVDEGGDPAVAN
jgi:EF hand